jgi:transcriptional regulator with XRE-family HTH domain
MHQAAEAAADLPYADETFAERLLRWRRRLGLTQAELANALDVRRYTVIRMEKGEQDPDIKQLSAIAEITEQPLEYWAEPFSR